MGNTICNNDLCSYRKTCKDQSRNTLHWEFLDRKKICKHCGVWGSTVKCNARKLVEFDSVEQHVTVYHIIIIIIINDLFFRKILQVSRVFIFN